MTQTQTDAAARAPRLTQHDKGVRDALLKIADLATQGKTRDEALLLIEEHLERHGIVREWVGA